MPRALASRCTAIAENFRQTIETKTDYGGPPATGKPQHATHLHNARCSGQSPRRPR